MTAIAPAATPAPAAAPTAAAVSHARQQYSTRPLPQLGPLHARIAFREYNTSELATRFVDVMPDLTNPPMNAPQFTDLDQAIQAARQLADPDHDGTTDRPQAVIQARSSNSWHPNSFFIAPLNVVGAGGVHEGDVTSRTAAQWRGSADQLPRWNDTVDQALMFPVATAVSDSVTAGSRLLLRALVTGHDIAEREGDVVRTSWTSPAVDVTTLPAWQKVGR